MSEGISKNLQSVSLQPLQAEQVLQKLKLPNEQEALKTQNLFSRLKDAIFGATASTTFTYTRRDEKLGDQQITAAIIGTRREIKALNKLMKSELGTVAREVNDLVEKQMFPPNYGKTYWSKHNKPAPFSERIPPAEIYQGPSQQPDAPPKGSLPPRTSTDKTDLEQSTLYKQRDAEIRQGHPNAPPASLPHASPSPVQPNGLPDAQRNFLIAQREAEIAAALAEAARKREAPSTPVSKPAQAAQDSAQIEKKIGQFKDQIEAEKINRAQKTEMKAPPRLLARIDQKIAEWESQVAELERELDF